MTRRVLSYALAFLLTLACASSALYALKQARRNAPDPAGDLPGKTAFYLAHASVYDLVFLGDSRTYCAMHPELLDPLLGTRSFNLAHWAHWLPTQYAHLRVVLDALPPSAVLVWSVGELNFQPNPIYDKYPLGLANARRLLNLGYAPAELAENLLTFNPATFLYAYRGVLMERTLAFAARPLAPSAPPVGAEAPGTQSTAEPHRPGVLRTEVQAPEGRPVAVSRILAGGGYLLEELDPAHFRVRQHSGGSSPVGEQPAPAGPVAEGGAFTPSPSRWATFLAMLDLCRERGVRLVINVLEEAPYRYPDRQALERVRSFMDGPVRREVEVRGFVYLRADLDQLTDADYFDFDHLNERGAMKYSRLLAGILRPYLPSPVRH